MKSLQIQNLGTQIIPDPENYSDLQVMQSAAGFYLGTVYNNPEGFQEPGSRDSTYFQTKEDAEFALTSLIEHCKNIPIEEFEKIEAEVVHWEASMTAKFTNYVMYRFTP